MLNIFNGLAPAARDHLFGDWAAREHPVDKVAADVLDTIRKDHVENAHANKPDAADNGQEQ